MSLDRVRQSLRTLRRQKRFVATAVVCLGVAIALNTTMYSVLDALLKPRSDVRDPEQIVRWDYYGDYRQLIPRADKHAAFVSTSFHQGVAAQRYGWDDQIAERGSRVREVQTSIVTPNWFGFLGLHATEGRLLDERDLGAPELGVVRQALNHMLRQQEPYPAVVVDRLWNLLDANEPANRLTAFLLDGVPGAAQQTGRPNLLRSILARDMLRTRIDNWEEVARHLVRTTYAEILADGGEPKALAFIEDIMAYPDVPASFRKLRFEERPTPVLTLDLMVGGKALSVFTTIATLGTPQDITLQEVRVECFFPADEATESFFRRS